MAVDSYDVIELTHFDGCANLTPGQANAATLAQMLRKIKAGRHTFGAGATETVTFGEAFADANYTIVFGQSTTAADAIYASKAAGSFDITAAAAGIVDWIAIHD